MTTNPPHRQRISDHISMFVTLAFMFILGVVLFLTCQGCGGSTQRRIELRPATTPLARLDGDVPIDPRLVPFVSSYLRERAVRRPDLPPPRWGGPGEGSIALDTARTHAACGVGAIGCCTRLKGGDVYLDGAWLAGHGPMVWNALVHHELGHCVDGLGHVPGPGRIMSATLSDDERGWLSVWTFEVADLFSSVPHAYK